MDGQKKLEYYLFYHPNITDKTTLLFAYGDFYEFFRKYDADSGKWQTSALSFSQMTHDYRFEEISEEEARKLTGGNLPADDYKTYCDFWLNRN